MRELNIGTKRFTKVIVKDEPGPGGACHEYYINGAKTVKAEGPFGEYGYIHFQKGPVKEAGVNGCHQEDLIAIVIDRLQCFQSGKFRCRENVLALTKLEEALHWLNHRTNDRIERRVDGTSKK